MKKLLCSLLLLGATVARADDAHYQNFLFGEEAAGMGGAFTAIAHDPSGTYYNPAGLVDGTSGILSANLNFYGFQQQSLSNALHVPSSTVLNSLTNSIGAAVAQLNTVAGSAGTLHGLGTPDEKGRYKHAWALSVLIPDATTSSTTSYFVNPTGSGGAGSLASLAQTDFDQTLLVGLGYALRYNEQWSFGLSVNGLYRQITENWRTISANNYGTAGPSQSFYEDDISLRMAVLGLYLQVGALYHLTSKLTLGATIATPSLTVFSTGSVDEVRVGQATVQNGLTETYQPSLQGDSRWPVHGRVGAAYQVRSDVLVTADVSLWGLEHYGLVNNATANQGLPNFVNDITRNVTANFDVGAQYLLFRKYPVRGGFFTNFSSAPGIDSGAEAQLSNVNLYGGTLGFTLPGVHTESTFGVTVAYGSGQSKTPTGSTATEQLTYQTGGTTQLFLNLYAGGSYRF